MTARRLKMLDRPSGYTIRPGQLSAAVAARLERDLDGVADLDYTGWARRFVPHLFPSADGLLHEDLDQLWSEIRTRRGARENILGHRAAAKTTRTRPLILRSALEGWEPYMLLVMDTFTQAEQQLGNVKHELTQNQEIARAYPEVFGEGPKWRDDYIVLKNGVRIDALGTGQKVRGRIHLSRRPTLIICDDLQSDEQVQSDSQRRKAWNWFIRALLNAGDEDVTSVVNLASTLHPEAIACQLAKQGAWRTRRYPAIIEWPTRMDLWEAWEQIFTDAENLDRQAEASEFIHLHPEMSDGAVLQWPARFTLMGLMQRRALGHAAFESEMQTNPIDPETCEFDPRYFENIMVEGWPTSGMTVKTVAIDPSKGKDAKVGDYSAIIKLGRHQNGLIYVEADLERRPPRQIVEDGIEIWKDFRPDAFGIEAEVFQSLFLTVFELEAREQGVPMAVSAINQGGVKKAVRIRRLDSFLARRLMRFVDTPGTRMLLDQLRYWPQADHDDGPDALEMALRLAIEVFNDGNTPAPAEDLLV